MKEVLSITNKESVENIHYEAISEFFPDYPINGIIKAWHEPNRAFSLTWLELEILSQCSNWASIQFIRSYLENRYEKEDIRSESSFYRIIKNLVDENYLTKITEEKGSSLVKLTAKGALELGRFERYHTEKIITRIQGIIIQKIIERIRKETGCLHKKLFISYTYKDYFVKKTLEMCSILDAKEKQPHEHLSNYFLYIDENQLSTNQINEQLEYFKIDNTGLINLKENLAEVFIGGGLLSDLVKKSDDTLFLNVIKELKRIIKTAGTYYFMEQIIDNNTMIIKYLYINTQLKVDDTTMNLKKAILSKEEVINIITKHFNNYEIIFDDIFLVVKTINR